MAVETLGASFTIDTTDLKAGLAQANRLIRESESQFKAAAAGMDDWESSAEGVQNRITHLTNTIGLQQKKVDALQTEYDRLIAEGLDPASKAATEMRIKINQEKTALEKNKKELETQTKALEKLGDESGQTGRDLDKLGKSAKDAGDGFTVAKGAIAGFIANGLSALVGACKNAISSVLGLADATREYRQTLATLDTAANDVGVSTDFIQKKFTDLMGVFNDEDSITEGLNNLLTAGFDESSLDNITQSLEGAALKWKDTLKFEGLSDSLQEWIGSGGANLTGNFAELLERLGYNLEEVQEKTAGMTDEQRRNYAMNILNSEGLDKVSENYREQNKDMVDAQKANIAYQNSVAAMGDRIEPVTTKIREGFTKIINKILELTNNIDFEALGAKISDAFDKFINDIMPKIVDGLQWVIDNKDGIIAGVAGIGAAFLAWKAVSIIQGVTNAMKGMTAAQWLLNVAMNANPIGLIVAAIAGLVTAFVVLWNKSEAFRNFWIDLWNKIKETCKPVIDFIKVAFSAAWEKIKSVWDGAKKYFQYVWNQIKTVFSVVKSVLTGDFRGAWEGIKKIFSNVGEFFGGIWDTIKEKFSSVGTKIGEAIGGAFKTAINAVIKTVESGINFIPNAINKMTSKINELPGVNIGQIPTVSLPRLAKGGIVKKATTALIGENGAEAIMPLERNTRWIKKLASEIAAEQKQNVVVNQTNNYSQAHSRYELYKTKQQTAAAVRLALGGAK